MAIFCATCERPFIDQKDLDQHLQDSPAHNPVGFKPRYKPLHFGVSPAAQEQVPLSRLVFTTTSRNGQPSSIATPQPSRQQSLAEDVQHTEPQWAVLSEPEHSEALDALSTHSTKELQDNGFLFRPYDPKDYLDVRKCKRCRGLEKNVKGKECIFHPSKRAKNDPAKPFKCCNDTNIRGCTTMIAHDFYLPLRAARHADSRETPAASAKQPKARAVVLDCEMATVVGNAPEAILVCATDYTTGRVLLNHYVFPGEPIIQMNSRFHGVTKSAISNAKSGGFALLGWKSARKELWKHIDGNTILIGHALNNDLDVLRVIHHRIVDSAILARNAVGLGPQRGLQLLCDELLNIPFRKNKRGIHDCLEDVLATREVVLSCTYLNKEALVSWASVKRVDQMRLEEEREKVKQEKAAKKAEEKPEATAEKTKSDEMKMKAGSSKGTEETELSAKIEQVSISSP